MENEKWLADFIFSREPLSSLNRSDSVAFASTDRKQLGLFHLRMLSQIEERLSAQFGGCLAWLEIHRGLSSAEIAADFLSSPEYRLVREDLNPLTQNTAARFEISFLNYSIRTLSEHPVLANEFGEIYLCELALG